MDVEALVNQVPFERKWVKAVTNNGEFCVIRCVTRALKWADS
jgi:hypothetical protein